MYAYQTLHLYFHAVFSLPLSIYNHQEPFKLVQSHKFIGESQYFLKSHDLKSYYLSQEVTSFFNWSYQLLNTSYQPRAGKKCTSKVLHLYFHVVFNLPLSIYNHRKSFKLVRSHKFIWEPQYFLNSHDLKSYHIFR